MSLLEGSRVLAHSTTTNTLRIQRCLVKLHIVWNFCALIVSFQRKYEVWVGKRDSRTAGPLHNF